MSTIPPWTGWPGGRRYNVPGPDMRVSDSERAEVADILAKHFGEGRLDQAEFDERMQKAMAAKTRSDLAVLLADLPAMTPAGTQPGEMRRRRGHVGLLLIAVFLFAVAVSVPVWPYHFPWFLFAVVFFLIWRVTRRGWGWRRHYGPWW
ncbi:MAG TPA: DUF1707 domain-containing protein [Acidimicrobiaceae bacterium]|nr:DUF1707 domain-containing protein [Acidimicrobiaceae bacterium]